MELTHLGQSVLVDGIRVQMCIGYRDILQWTTLVNGVFMRYRL